MVAVPHFMKERRKHSQTIVWLCHRKLFLLRIVLYLQTSPSFTSLCLKSCWPVSWQSGNGHCPGNRRVRLSGPQRALLRRGEISNEILISIFFPFLSSTWAGAGCWAKGPHADVQAPGRGSLCSQRALPQRGHRCHSHRRGFQLHSPENFSVYH